MTTPQPDFPRNGNYVDLRDFVERLIHESDRRYEQRFISQEKAVISALSAANAAVAKAEAAAERRFEGQNEFRAQLTDQAATFMRRTEVEQIVKALIDKSDDRLAGVQSKLDTLNALIGSAMPRGEYEAAHKELGAKVERLDQNDRLRTGRSSGFESTRVMVFAVLAGIGTLTSVVLSILYAVGR